jgi:hypothetical protein
MKGAIPLLVLSNFVVAPAAIATDAKEVLRDHLAFCSQFLVQDPAPGIAHTYDCCAFSQNIRDCHICDWHNPSVEPESWKCISWQAQRRERSTSWRKASSRPISNRRCFGSLDHLVVEAGTISRL